MSDWEEAAVVIITGRQLAGLCPQAPEGAPYDGFGGCAPDTEIFFDGEKLVADSTQKRPNFYSEHPDYHYVELAQPLLSAIAHQLHDHPDNWQEIEVALTLQKHPEYHSYRVGAIEPQFRWNSAW